MHVQVTDNHVEMAEDAHCDVVDQITKLDNLSVVNVISAEVKLLVKNAF